MIYLTLNLAMRPWYNRRLFNTVLAAAVLLQLLLIVVGGVMVLKKNMELQRLEDEVRSLDGQLTRHKSGLTQKELGQQQQKLELVNAILEQRSRQHWLQQLDEIEKLVPDSVVLTKLEPDSNKGQGVILHGRCKGFTDLQHLLENLAKSSRFSEPVLISHSTLQSSGQASLLQFAVNVKLVSR
jgi:Tfp pilus assembly protein PilN